MKVDGLRSPYERVGELVYFGRMLDKIRLHQAGKLPEEYHPNLGRGFDARCVHLLKVNYNDLCDRVAMGGTDQEILDWCNMNGHPPDDECVYMFNLFLMKAGWRDRSSGLLERRKKEGGLEDRDDIVTMFDFIDVDEGREPLYGKLPSAGE